MEQTGTNPLKLAFLAIIAGIAVLVLLAGGGQQLPPVTLPELNQAPRFRFESAEGAVIQPIEGSNGSWRVHLTWRTVEGKCFVYADEERKSLGDWYVFSTASSSEPQECSTRFIVSVLEWLLDQDYPESFLGAIRALIALFGP